MLLDSMATEFIHLSVAELQDRLYKAESHLNMLKRLDGDHAAEKRAVEEEIMALEAAKDARVVNVDWDEDDLSQDQDSEEAEGPENIDYQTMIHDGAEATNDDHLATHSSDTVSEVQRSIKEELHPSQIMAPGMSPPRKRQRKDKPLSDQQMSSESVSAASTSASSPVVNMDSPTSEGSAFDIPEDMFEFLGGNPRQAMKEMRAEQRRHEKLAEERRARERADEEYARQLQDDWNNDDNPGWSAPLGPGTMNGRSSQSLLDGNGRYHRPQRSPSPLTPLTSFPQSSDIHNIPHDMHQHNVSLNTYDGPTPFITNRGLQPFKATDEYSMMKEEQDRTLLGDMSFKPQHQQSSTLSTDPGDFIVLSSDDDDDDDGPQVLESLSSRPLWLPKKESYDGNELLETGSKSVQHPHSSRMLTTTDPSQYSINQTTTAHPQVPGSWNFPLANLGETVVNGFQTAFGRAQELLGSAQGSAYSTGPGSHYGRQFIDLLGDEPLDSSHASNFMRHGLDANDPANRHIYDRYMERVDYVSNDPTRTAAEIKSLLENIRPDEDLPPEDREGTPEAMVYPLMEHQKLGLAWLKRMEESDQKGGILADDMGLGKTIQALALMVSRRSDDPLCKTTLIIAPVALMRQWEREIKVKLKPDRASCLKTFILHGASRSTTWEKLRNFDVVLTTFGTLGSEYKRRMAIEENKAKNPNWRPTSREDYLPTLGEHSKWYRVIIDEAQCVKNRNTKAALAACLLKSKTRFCMTGTPMMNSIDELYSLIRFLRIQPWQDSHKFSANFSRPMKGNSASAKEQAMRKLQVLLKAILLRRTKKSQIDGKPILELRPRTTEPQHATFTPDETTFYDALQTQTQLQFNKYLRAGTVGRNYSNILVLLLRLRQACCHPHLIKNFAQEGGPTGEITLEKMTAFAQELAPNVIARIKEQTEANEASALECPICMDMTENATIFLPCGHNTCSECFARISDPALAIANGDGETRGGEAKCPNCRGKISPSRVIDHTTFRQVHMTRPEDVLAGGVDAMPVAEESEDSDTDSEDETTTDEEIDKRGNIRKFIVPDNVADDEVETTDGDSSEKQAKSRKVKAGKRKDNSKGKGKGKGKKEKKPKQTLAQLKQASRANKKARQKYFKRLQKEYITSSKLDKTMELLTNFQTMKTESSDQPPKTIIFSQFTSLLDLLEIPINAAGWAYTRYDGSMNANQRNEAVIDFTEKDYIRIMLISLKAGNAGLNLTAASKVIILDPFWNPYIEEQAIDRAHRIGQRNPVEVHRILIPNTVEDRIIALQEKKRELIESALDEGEGHRIARLGNRELAFLFDVPLER